MKIHRKEKPVVDFSLAGKVAVITGASRGIGEEMAKAFAEHGAHCILVSRKQEAVEAVAGAIRDRGFSAEARACHMGRPDQIEKLFDSIRETHGTVNILVNNAATNPHFGAMMDADAGMWDKIIDVNLKGPFFMIQNAVRLMMAAGKGGAILNISSINAESPGLMQGVYSVSKAALVSMTKVFAKELAPFRIRVNALLPGLTDTKFSKALIDTKEIHDYVVQQIPMGRHAEPSEMAGAALYLVSDAASYTTGACLAVDGGILI
jgi:NAD(P)-dependent dehydrogenase (short-subunit alcohol dehydrogenase family)